MDIIPLNQVSWQIFGLTEWTWNCIVYGMLSTLMTRFFLRKPERNIPEGSVILSPAHGKITSIFSTQESLKLNKGLWGRILGSTTDIAPQCWVVSIRMNLFNVHVQRAPLAGIVNRACFTPGTFHNAVWRARQFHWLENAKNEIEIQSLDFPLRYKVIQVAGYLARAIRCSVSEGDEVAAGDELGYIALGSAVVLVLPHSPRLRMFSQVGQKVVDGETLIAKIA